MPLLSCFILLLLRRLVLVAWGLDDDGRHHDDDDADDDDDGDGDDDDNDVIDYVLPFLFMLVIPDKTIEFDFKPSSSAGFRLRRFDLNPKPYLTRWY